jgi:GDP/GTP exchange factor required for growth at low temperature
VQNIGKLALIRTFVTIRHWLLNYFTEDFIASPELRDIFITSINSLTHSELFVQRIIGNLKKTWTECCNKSWDENVSANDYYSFVLKVGPQSNKSKRLSTLAISQQNNPMVRNSTILSTFDPNRIHRLPVPNEKTGTRQEPRLLLNPKNSISGLNKRSQNPNPKLLNDTPLYTSLTSRYDSRTRNTIRDSTDFPKTSKLSKVLPPTPVKKMDIIVPLPRASKPEPQRGLRPLIEKWLTTFHKHSETKTENVKNMENFMKSVVSVSKIDPEKLNDLVSEKFDILSARTIDDLECLVRFHNEIVGKHGIRLGLNNASESFNFINQDMKDFSTPVKTFSNIDNMNICGTISDISKSVLSLRQLVEDDNRSFISYDSGYLKESHKSPQKSFYDDGVKKKKGIPNLREFNFELGAEDARSSAVSTKDDLPQEVDTEKVLNRFSSSVISESTSIEVEDDGLIDDAEKRTGVSKDVCVAKLADAQRTKSTIDIEEREEQRISVNDETQDDNIRKSEIPEEIFNRPAAPNLNELIEEVKALAEEVAEDNNDDIPPRSPDRLSSKEASSELKSPDTAKDPQRNSDVDEASINETPIDEIPNVENPTARAAEVIDDNRDDVEENEQDHPVLAPANDNDDSKSLQDQAIPSENSRQAEAEHSDYDDIESVVSSYEDPEVEELEAENDTWENNNSFVSDGPKTPPSTNENNGLISSTPNISPIKSIGEANEFYEEKPDNKAHSSEFVKSNLDLNRAPSFTRVSNGSVITTTSDCDFKKPENDRVSYLSKRSHKVTISETTANSIFSGYPNNQKFVNFSVDHENESPETSAHSTGPKGDETTRGRKSNSISLIASINSENYAIPYPGVNSDVMAELAGITDDSVQDDPIAAALLKLEGTYRKRARAKAQGWTETSLDSNELLKRVESLRITSTPNKRNSIFVDQRRKTKLFSLTPVAQKDVSQELSSSKVLLELLLSRKIENEAILLENSEQHVSFILNYDSKTLAEQFTLIEKDCLLEIDWKELVEFKWDSSNLSPINSWLELLIQNDELHGIDLCISRFNLTVNWIISEILLTKDLSLRKLTIQRFIHVAQKCKDLQNFSTLMQILLALGSDKVMKLKDTWRMVEPGDILIYKNLESIASPLKNFMNLRKEINKLKPSVGCVPFLGLYLSDLIFNKEKKSAVNGMINFGKFMHDSKIVRFLIQCIQWSMLYKIEVNDEVLSKCLYIKSLTEEEMNVCVGNVS